MKHEPSSTACVLFVDISDSTRLYEELGDDQAYQMTQKCINMLQFCTKHHAGRVIKTIGDEAMCEFSTVSQAVQAAVEMQKVVSVCKDSPEQVLSIKIGLHFGAVLEENGDLYGDTVNTAARIVGQANAHQILMSDACAQALPEWYAQKTRWMTRVHLKGKQEAFDLFELEWGKALDTTVQIRKPATTHTVVQTHANRQLRVELKGIQATVDASVCSVSLGRAASNQLVLNTKGASRVHVRFEYHAGRFMLIDQSTNGTVVKTSRGEQLLSQNAMEVPRTGQLIVGAVAKHPGETINFCIHE